jgi:hypothetical protein
MASGNRWFLVALVVVTTLTLVDGQEQAAQWVKTHEWSGSGIEDTQPFKIVAAKWKIKYSNMGGGLLQITVYKGKELVDLAANTTKAGADESVLRSKGEHHLQINSANTSWQIQVEQFVTPQEATELRKDSKAEAPPLKSVASWRGTGIKNTDDFTIGKAPWKLVYSITGKGLLQISVYQGENLVSMAGNFTGPGKGESWVHQAGSFHLRINSANTDWQITVLGPQ